MRVKAAVLVSLVSAALVLAACGGDSSSTLGSNELVRELFVPGEMGNWSLEEDEKARAFIEGERLVIAIEEPQLIHYASLAQPAVKDFDLQVDVTRLAGDLEGSAGVMFRMLGPDQFYRFDITGTGLYMIERRDANGTWTRFLGDWKESEAIRNGLNATNRLKVVARGAVMAFYINDNLILEASDSSYSSGRIALDAGSFGQGGVQVAFDNLIVTLP